MAAGSKATSANPASVRELDGEETFSLPPELAAELHRRADEAREGRSAPVAIAKVLAKLRRRGRSSARVA